MIRKAFILLNCVIVCSGLLCAQDSVVIDYKNDTLGYESGDWNYNLLIAAEIGNIAHAKHFVKGGADVNTVTFEGLSPLFYAIFSNNYDLVSFLLSKGANTDKLAYDGMSPLSACANNNFLELGELLIQSGAKIDIEDYRKRTPLYYSVANDYFYFTDMLIQYGANLNWKDTKGISPLMMACLYGNFDIAELMLLKGAGYEEEDEKGNSPLILAVQGGNAEVVKLLVTYGANINKTNQYGYTALSYAILNNDALMVTYLLENGADPNYATSSSKNTINLAKAAKNREVEQLLLGAGAKKDSRISFNKMNVSLGSSFSSKDIFLSSKIGMYDSRYAFAFNLLYGIRATSTNILVEERENYYYQVREKRSYVGMSVEKEIKIMENENLTTGFNISVAGLYSYSNYMGFENENNNLALISPGIGIYRASEKLFLTAGFTYTDFNTLQFPKGRFTVELMYRFNIGKNNPENVSIKW